MSEIEKMKRYIERTKMDKNYRFCMNFKEAVELSHMMRDTAIPAEIISLAFDYGKAKGYRSAKAEARR